MKLKILFLLNCEYTKYIAKLFYLSIVLKTILFSYLIISLADKWLHIKAISLLMYYVMCLTSIDRLDCKISIEVNNVCSASPANLGKLYLFCQIYRLGPQYHIFVAHIDIQKKCYIVVLFEFFVWHTKGQYSYECNQKEN